MHFETGTQFTGTVQPATSPSGRYETAQAGTEYFMSAQDCEPPDCHVDEDSLENTIHVWALTHTSTLRSATPGLRLFDRTVKSQVYGQPVPQRQKNGPHPLGESHNEPVPPVESNDARMNQVVFAAGRLWGGVNTIANPGPRDGIAWFSVTPSISSTGVHADITKQGYVAGKDRTSFVSFPSIGVNDNGNGVIAYSLMGDKYYPSAAQTGINRRGLTTGSADRPQRLQARGRLHVLRGGGLRPELPLGRLQRLVRAAQRRSLVGDRVHRRQRQDDVRQLEHVRLAVHALNCCRCAGRVPARRSGAAELGGSQAVSALRRGDRLSQHDALGRDRELADLRVGGGSRGS